LNVLAALVMSEVQWKCLSWCLKEDRDILHTYITAHTDMEKAVQKIFLNYKQCKR